MSALRHAKIYPRDALAANRARMDAISPRGTLHDAFCERVKRSPQKTAYIEHTGGAWKPRTWQWMAQQVERRRRALANLHLQSGARAAVRMRNCVEWILYEQACFAAGLVLVPLYAEDNADNIAYILAHTEARVLLIENARMWSGMADARLPKLQCVLLNESRGADELKDSRAQLLSTWLDTAQHHAPPPAQKPGADDLATIVYTSGTTGRPKGVMLTHANILQNAHAGLKSIAVFPGDMFLSFLPLSHMFERTVGCCLPMMAGAVVAFNRSIPQLADDLAELKPSFLISVPRIFERAYGAMSARLERAPKLSQKLFAMAVETGWRRFEIAQGRAKWSMRQLLWPVLDALVAKKIRARFGGKLRLAVCGGAPLAPKISRVFIALGVPVVQGYGLTETGPTLCVNTRERNNPASVGLPFIGVEIRLSERGELQARGPNVMRGYWRNESATRDALDADGWFASGDIARIDEHGFIFIVGRVKEIIVTATGEKAPPADMEAAICDHALFEQAMVIGEGRAFLSALVVLHAESWRRHAAALGVDAADDSALAGKKVCGYILRIIAEQLRDFPGYAAVRRVHVLRDAWSVQDGALTPTMKIKRNVLRERFAKEIESFYA